MYAAQLARKQGRPGQPSCKLPETAIIIESTSRPARLAAGVLLSLMLMPAQAGQPSPRQPAPRCDNGERATAPCPGAKQPAEATRRPRAGAAANGECSRLTTAILESEAAELRPRSAMMESVQQDLAALRKRHKALGC